MTGALSPRAGIALLLLIAVAFASNHVAARVAFDHGASVSAAIVIRSAGTAVFVLALMRIQGVSLALSRGTFGRAVVVGAILAIQSFCLYSAVARIHPALALLSFQTFPVTLALISWILDGVRPSRRSLLAMPVILVGLALALDVAAGFRGTPGGDAGFGLGPGVAFGLGAGLAFALLMYLTTRWLADVDGRLRTFVSLATTTVLVSLAGPALGGFALPAAAPGWAGLGLLTFFYGAAITSLFVLLPRLGAVNNAVVLGFEPIAVLGLAWVVLGQGVGPVQVLGAFLVVGAIAYLSVGSKG